VYGPAVAGRPARRPARTLPPVGLVVGLCSAILQLAPVLGSGYVLARDMVFVPRLPLTGALLGRDGVPRAVPSDLLVALLSRIVPGGVVQDVVLVAIIALAGWGVARLVPSDSTWAAAAAAALYTWNPYVTERLRLGQWAVLVGYAALPWVAAAAIRCRGELRSRSVAALLLALAGAATGGASAELLAALVAVPVLLWPGGRDWSRRTAALAGSLVAVALPWLVPALLNPAPAPADHVGVALFATRPDTPFGSLGSLLSLGGVWNAQVVPAGRDGVLVGLAALLLTAAACYGLGTLRGRWDDGALSGLVCSAVLGLMLAMWGVTPGARDGLMHLVAAVPSAGLLRDGQRSVAPLALALSVGIGAVAELLAARWRAAVLVAVPVALLPAAAWGADATLASVHWPAAWQQVATSSAQLPAGPVLVLPWATERAYPWNGDRTQIDPADHWLPRRVVGDDALLVGDRSTPVEDPLARRVAAAATGTGPLLPVLQRQGYAGVLVETDQAGASALPSRLTGLRLASSAGDLALYGVPGSVPVDEPRAPLVPIVVGDLLAALAVAVSLTICVARRTSAS
jgi:hypothetical protein